MKRINVYDSVEPTIAFAISNSNEDYREDSKHCLLNIQIWKKSIWIKIPEIFKPVRKWVDLSKDSWATPNKDGVKGYWNVIQRDYGILFTPSAIHIRYGIQPGLWSRSDPKNSDHVKLFNYPWQLHHIRHNILDKNLKVKYNSNEWYDLSYGNSSANRGRIFKDAADPDCIKFFYYFDESNQSSIAAKGYIEEREWHRGVRPWIRSITKYFKWGKQVRRSFVVDFSEEVGCGRGSWKGGVLGCSIEISDDDTFDDAVKKFKTKWKSS